MKSEKLSYAQMAQKLPPPPPPPLPEAANYMPPSPTLSDSPNTPSHSSQHMGFFKETSDSISNGRACFKCILYMVLILFVIGCRGSQDTDTSKYSQRKPFVRSVIISNLHNSYIYKQQQMNCTSIGYQMGP